MPVVVIVANPAATAESHQKVTRRLHHGQPRPAGLIFMVASPANPGYQVIAVWEDLESFTRFRDERLNPALEAEGVSRENVTMKTFETTSYIAADRAGV